MTFTLSLPDSLPRKFAGVLFDMDGLLIDSEAISTEAWRTTLADFDIPLEDADIKTMFGMRILDDAIFFVQKYHLPIMPEALIERRNQHHFVTLRESLQPMPGAHDIVAWFNQHAIPIALATSGTAPYVDLCLSVTNLSDAFPIRVMGEDVLNGKPDPEGYLKAAAQLGIAPQDCLVFEDAPHGVQAGHNAGMHVIAIVNEQTRDLTFPVKTTFLPSLRIVQSYLAN